MLTLPPVALSIRQPWASPVAAGVKDIENRTWATKYRGPVLIHAGKASVDRDDLASMKEILRANRETIIKPAAWALDSEGREWPRNCELPRGGIVGVADIVNCVETHASPWFFGPFGFVLANARPLPFFPCKGALGFFAVNYPAELTCSPSPRN